MQSSCSLDDPHHEGLGIPASGHAALEEKQGQDTTSGSVGISSVATYDLTAACSESCSSTSSVSVEASESHTMTRVSGPDTRRVDTTVAAHASCRVCGC